MIEEGVAPFEPASAHVCRQIHHLFSGGDRERRIVCDRSRIANGLGISCQGDDMVTKPIS